MDVEGVNPKDLIGVQKAPLRFVPPALLAACAPVMALGAQKYGLMNWRQYPVKLSVYLEAMQRHLVAALDGEWFDPESGEPHVAHVAACVGIILDAQAIGHLVKDWPPGDGGVAGMLAAQDRSKNPVEDSGDVDDREAEKAALVKDMLSGSRGFDVAVPTAEDPDATVKGGCYSDSCTIHNPTQVPYSNEVEGP